MSDIINKQYFLVSGKNASWNYELPQYNIRNDFTHVCVSSVSIPKTYYVLPNDCTLIVDENGENVSISMSKGNYNAINLKTAIEALLNSECKYTYTMSYNERKVKYVWTVTNNDSQPALYIDDEYLSNILGLPEGTPHVFESNTLESVDVINFQSYDSILIKSNITKNTETILQEIYTTGTPYNTSIVWICPNIELYGKPLSTNSSNTFEFRLLDGNGRLIDLNGSKWSMVLCFYQIVSINNLIRDYILFRVREKIGTDDENEITNI